MILLTIKHSFASCAVILVFTILWSTVKTQNYNQLGLVAHNNKRLLHKGVAPITLDYEAQQAALKCAKYYTEIKKIDHSCPHKKTKKYKPRFDSYGENLYISTSKKSENEMINKAIDKWYNEIPFWDFQKGEAKQGTKILQSAHFTQLIWKNTKTVGMGIHTDPSFGTVVVALYGPSGNDWKQAKENVAPPK